MPKLGKRRRFGKVSGMNYVIGIDFDNTLVSYDDVLYDEALQRGLIHLDSGKGKKDIRDMIRRKPNGEIE